MAARVTELFWLTDAQMERLKPFFPLSHGRPRVDDRRVLSGIIFVNRNGLRWRDAPPAYGPPKTLYNRWVRWGRMGIFARMLKVLAEQACDPSTVMIDATHLKAHRTAASLRGKKGRQTAHWTHQGRPELKAACPGRRQRPAPQPVSECRSNERLYRRPGAAAFDARGPSAAG
jgi:transposase